MSEKEVEIRKIANCPITAFIFTYCLVLADGEINEMLNLRGSFRCREFVKKYLMRSFSIQFY